MKFLVIMLKNIGRNKLRTLFTGLGTMLLVLMVTMIWSILGFLDEVLRDKATNFKVIVTEKWQIPSQMPFYPYGDRLSLAGQKSLADAQALGIMDSMTWQFFGGTLDKGSNTRDNMVFAFAMEPAKIATMMDELEDLEGPRKAQLQTLIDKMTKNPQGILLGDERLALMNKKVGERIQLHGLNYRDITLDLEIIGTVPTGTRYGTSAFINRDYVNRSLEKYKLEKKKDHPMANRSLNLVWLKVKDKAAFQTVASTIMGSPEFTSPAVKCETQSSGISTFMEGYKDIFRIMRYLMVPAALVTLALVVANAISISVRERRHEFAVMKVLGFQPWYILMLVLGEALVVSLVCSLLSAGGTWFLINKTMGGLSLPIGFFGRFFIQDASMLWGILAGTATALIGSLLPAWSAQSVKVAEVFSKVA